jgi:hypothetical protein
MPTNEGYTVHDGNPNDRIGGGGCLATGGKPHEDCAGKWINFFNTQTEYHASPYAAICEYHLARVVEGYDEDDVQHEVDVLALRPAIVQEADLPPAVTTPYVKV